jgi:hypothetical protein
MGIAACIAVALAVAASAAPALAGPDLPEWGRCIAKPRAPFSDAACTEHAATRSGGSYAWVHLIESAEHAVGKAGASAFESVSGHEISCVSSDVGWSRPRQTVNLVVHAGITFNGCVEMPSGESCGTFSTEDLNGRLGFIAGAGSPEPAVGMRLYPALHRHKHRWLSNKVSVKCGGREVMIKGAAISTIEPVDVMASTFTRTFDESAPGIQSITSLQGEGGSALEANFKGAEPFSQTALIQESVTTTSEPVEIRAYVK